MSSKDSKPRDLFDIDYLVSLASRYWLIIGISIITGLLCALLYNIFSLPIFEVRSSILLKNDRNDNILAVNQLFGQTGFLNNENSFENKMEVLKSTPLIQNAIENLDFQISYFSRSGPIKKELYKNSPFIVVLNQEHPQPIKTVFKIEILDDNTFRIKANSNEAQLYSVKNNVVIQNLVDFKLDITSAFNSQINSENYDFKLILNQNFDKSEFKTNKYAFIINDLNTLTKQVQDNVKVEQASLQTTIANLSLKTKVPAKDIDLLKSITNEYVTKDINEKIHASVKTLEYIDGQLGAISDSLHLAELNLQQFRTANQVIDISAISGRAYDQLQDLEREKGTAIVRYKYFQYINEYFEKNKEMSDMIAPSSMGIEDPLLNNLIQELTTLNAEKTSLIENNQGKSPYLRQIDIKIDNLKNTISENIKYIINSTEISLKDIDSRINVLNNELRKLPTTQRKLLGFERKFNLNDAIYTFLLQRRAEAQISKASYLPGAEIIEPSDIVGDGQISPKKTLNYFIGFLFGLIVPFVGLYMREVIQDKVTDHNEILKILGVPLLGKIYENNKKIELVVKSFPKSHIAESFRLMRTGLNYFVEKNVNSVLLITSAIGQEGKSFVSGNFATSIANANKRTILLGFDLRRPKTAEGLKVHYEFGISTYLSNQAPLEEVIQKTDIENLDVITSGPIPPNPSELISSNKTNELISILKEKYNYIIIDTPPIGLLSDTYKLLELADLNIFVIRQDHTPRKELLSIMRELKMRNIKKLCIVINNIPLMKHNKYGYQYYEK
ncbi:MAG: polysaccharide biosynthesis tyrosine autokinase [Bacteroidales bacterium]|nr:polysaccharide biosynthesis tyrosine autokinase [Bacteroidales bacterium]